MANYSVQEEEFDENDEKKEKNDGEEKDEKETEDEKTLLSNTVNNTNIPANSPANHVLVTPSPNIHTPPRIGSINDLSKLIADVARSQTQQKIIIGTHHMIFISWKIVLHNCKRFFTEK